MKIRFSDKNDFDKIIKLWNEAFGDSENDIRFFLDRKYIPQNTVILEENGEMASMLFLLDGKMCVKGIEYPSYYLYAACTSEKFRSRGFMANLLEKAKQVALDRGIDFICLMPGEKSLFDFYEKHGFLTAFNRKVLVVDRHEVDKTAVKKEKVSDKFEKLRNSAFFGFDIFKWDEDAIDFAFSHNKLYSGKLFTNCKGYCVDSENKDIATVKEFAFTPRDFEFGVALLASECSSETLIINLPSQYSTDIGRFEIVPSAMLYPVTERALPVADNLKNAYLGLTLD